MLQALGLALAAVVGPAFLVVCAACAVLGILYSHPLTRFKGRPWPSWLTVMFGQGVLGAICGVVAMDGPRVTVELALGVGAAAAIVGAIYPLSQIFQLEEDSRRGDRTVAMMLGRRGTPRVASALFTLGAALMAVAAWRESRFVECVLFVLAPLPLSVGAMWACRPTNDRAIFRRVAMFQIIASSTFGAYALVRLFA